MVGSTLMGENSHFKKALSDFTFDAAYGDSIRHLHDSGYSPEEIKEYLRSDSLTVSRICEVINKYEETGTADGKRYEYVKEYDPYGRACFVRKRTDDGNN